MGKIQRGFEKTIELSEPPFVLPRCKTDVKRIVGFYKFFGDVQEEKNNKSRFVTSTSSNTRTLTVEREGYKEKTIYSDDFFPMSLLPMVKKIKEDVLWHADAIRLNEIKDNPFDVEYYDFSPGIYQMRAQRDSNALYLTSDDMDVYEADISMCYYYTAFKLGFMSEKMFKLCEDLPKKHRLKLLGSIATSKTDRYYDEGKIIGSHVREIEVLRIAWFKICHYVAQAMQTIKNSLGKNFIFYWVDGVYFTFPKNADFTVEEMVADISKHLFFQWKIKKIFSMRLSNNYGKVEIRTIDNEGDHPDDYRFFYPPQKKIISYRQGSEYDFLNI